MFLCLLLARACSAGQCNVFVEEDQGVLPGNAPMNE